MGCPEIRDLSVARPTGCLQDSAMMRCTNCGHDNPEDARFCAQCGARLSYACVACEAPADPSHRFCQNCGAKLPWADQLEEPARPEPPIDEHEGERREVTVLFGDLTGFTRLSSGLDPEETHALLNRYFQSMIPLVFANRSLGFDSQS